MKSKKVFVAGAIVIALFVSCIIPVTTSYAVDVDCSDQLTIEAVEDQIYTGEEIKPEPEVKINGCDLSAYACLVGSNSDNYTVKYTYENNVEVGTATVTANIKIGNEGYYFYGMVSTTFTIVPDPEDIDPNMGVVGDIDQSIAYGEDISYLLTIDSVKDYYYTGSEITPTPTVYMNNNSIDEFGEGAYVLEYEYTDNVEVGTATITVYVTGVYDGLTADKMGVISTTFNILPALDPDIMVEPEAGDVDSEEDMAVDEDAETSEEEDDSLNPTTSDRITFFGSILLVALAGLFITIKIRKRANK